MNTDELEKALNELKTDMAKFDYVYAKSEGLSVEESVKKANRSRGWYYKLTDEEKLYLETLAVELNADTTTKAKMILDNAKIRAAKVKVSGLDSRDERIKQSASSEILDRTVGRVINNVDVTTKGESLNDDRRDDILRKLAGIAAAGVSVQVHSEPDA